MENNGRDKRTSQQIRRDIEATRAELRTTVDALERKLSVGRIVDEVLGKAPVALIGLGAAWLAVDKVRNTHLSGDLAEHSIGADEKMTPTLADKATGVASDAKDKLASGKAAVGNAAERARDVAAEGITKGKRGLKSLIDEQPLALGAVAFGLGLASGLVVPSSRWENEKMGEAAESVKDEASAMATEAVAGAKEIATEAASEAIGSVQEVVRAKDQDSDGVRQRAQGSSSREEGAQQR